MSTRVGNVRDGTVFAMNDGAIYVALAMAGEVARKDVRLCARLTDNANVQIESVPKGMPAEELRLIEDLSARWAKQAPEGARQIGIEPLAVGQAVQQAAKDDRHEWARVHDLRPGTIFTTGDGVSCVLTDRHVTLENDDGWGLAATIIGPPTHPHVGYELTVRIDDRVKPRALPTEIRQALRFIPRAPTKDDVVPRTTKDQKKFFDDGLGIGALCERIKRSLAGKREAPVTITRSDLGLLMCTNEQRSLIAQQAIETHDVLTAANVPDAKTLRERVESVLVTRPSDPVAELAIAEETPTESVDMAPLPWQWLREIVGGVVVTSDNSDNDEHAVHAAILQIIREHEGKYQNIRLLLERFGLDTETAFAESIRRLESMLKQNRDIADGPIAIEHLCSIIGRVQVINADYDAVAKTTPHGETSQEERDKQVKRAAAIRTITDAITERRWIHEMLNMAGMPNDSNGWVTTSINRLLARHEALERVQVAYSKFDSVAANGPLETWVAHLEQHLALMQNQAAMAKGWTDTFKALEQVGNTFAQMRAKTWATIAALRRCTNDRPTLIMPETMPCASLIDVFNNFVKWHDKADRELHDLAVEDDALERTAYLEGRATSYVHAMDLIVALGRDGYELAKQQ